MAAGRFFIRDRPRVPGLTSTQTTHAGNPFRNPLRMENDLAGSVAPGLHTQVNSNVLEQLEGLVRENLLQLSSLDTFLTALRLQNPTLDTSSTFWQGGVGSLCSAAFSASKVLANLVLMRRDMVMRGVPTLQNYPPSVQATLRTGPMVCFTLSLRDGMQTLLC